ncbi:MAG: tetratricopeptide repeat protein [Verrucomicrobiales bacterium]|nr:tetratricopeptide repeat protein [Verrucomicrobiales bacterium]
MSRFGKLELANPGLSPGRETRAGTAEPSCLASAEDAFGRGEFEPALRWFSRALEEDMDQVAAWSGQVRSLIELGEFGEARAWADKALERIPSAPDLLAAKAVVLGRLGELDPALAFSDASMGEGGDAPYVWLARGDVLMARGERRAEYCFDRACAMAPESAWVAWLAGRIRHHYGQHAAALQFARRAAALDPGNCAAWLLCGDCQRALGFAEEAEASFRQALGLRPDCRAAAERLSGTRSQGMAGRLTGWWRRQFGG